MKRVGVYVVFDDLAQQAGPLFEAENEAVAQRAMNRLLAQVAQEERKEYRLVKVGEFDRESLVIFAEEDVNV